MTHESEQSLRELRDEIIDLLHSKSQEEMQRQIDVAKTTEKSGLKQTLKMMINMAVDHSLDEIRRVVAKQIETMLEVERRHLNDLIRQANERDKAFQAAHDQWRQESEQAKLVAQASHLFQLTAISPKDRYGEAQYNRSLGLVLSAALGLKVIGAVQETSKQEK